MITVNVLTRFPVKGLSGQALNKVILNQGQGFPCDRRFGFARPESGFDPENPKPLPKTKFYMLARDASLALLNTAFDEETGVLKMSAADNVAEFDITTSEGKKSASQFLKAYLSLSDNEIPELYEASPHRFTDVSVVSKEMMNAVSIINLNSVSEFARTISQEVDPARFRGNIHLADMPAFSELDLVDQNMRIGSAEFKIVKRTKRCPATEVDLATGERNIKTPKLLQQHYGHMDMGIYAEVIGGGEISLGDVVKIG